MASEVASCSVDDFDRMLFILVVYYLVHVVRKSSMARSEVRPEFQVILV